VQGELGPLHELGGSSGAHSMHSVRAHASWDAGCAVTAPLLHARFVAPAHADAMPEIPAVMPGVDLPALLPLRGMSTAGARALRVAWQHACMSARSRVFVIHQQ
jgi:hypothetical protein